MAALDEDLVVLQPEHPNDPAFVSRLRELEVDLAIVVAYGHILKADLLALPRDGWINVHASLLPKFRGAAPIVHTILHGDEVTGITIMQLEAELDAGPIIHQVMTPVAPDETGGELTVRLAELGALALVEALTLIASGAAQPIPQDHELATYAPKISREQGRIRWTDSADRVARQVRALDPAPGAWTTLHGRDLKLFGPRLADEWEEHEQPGDVVETDPALIVATGSGALQFLDVQPAGRPRMAATDWVRGKNAKKGDRFE
jgi:methionyl-tRNA formyltransferase